MLPPVIVVDRIEADRAVLDVGGERVEVPLSALPSGTREGDVLRFMKDEAAKSQVIAEAEARLARLRARSQPGPDTTDL